MQRVLIVEDNRDSVEALKSVLDFERRDLVADAAYTAKEALCQLHRPYSLLLLDATLPDMDTDEMFDAVLKIHRLPPIVLMSGHHASKLAAWALRIRAVAILQKPFRMEQFLEVLRYVINEPCGDDQHP